MASSEKVIPKKKGRPATGKDPIVTFRCPVELTAKIDALAEAEGATRSITIRRLVEKALAGS